MESFDCPECDSITPVTVTEEERYEMVVTYMGICPRHDDVSISVNLNDLD